MALGYGRTGTNNFACAKFIVDTNGIQNGATHSTITAALADASSSDTIYVKPGTYTEDLTLKAGVNIVAYDVLTSQVSIVGKATASFSGTCLISGIELKTNLDFFLVVSGASATEVILNSCNLICSNNTGISITSSSSDSGVYIEQCYGDIETTGISFFSKSGAGLFEINYSKIANSGSSTTASTDSGGFTRLRDSYINFPITISTSGEIELLSSTIYTKQINTTSLTIGTTVSSGNNIIGSRLSSGTASALSIGGTARIMTSTIDSSNTNAITGAGTLTYDIIGFEGSSSLVNTTTTTPRAVNSAPISFDDGTNALNYYETGSWTPAMDATTSSPSVTYTSQVGQYTRIGNTVTVKARIIINTISGGSGTATITGLPFASDGTYNAMNIGNARVDGVDLSASTVQLVTGIDAGESRIKFIEMFDNASSGGLAIGAFANGDIVQATVTYFV